jgi:hypothetical protein
MWPRSFEDRLVSWHQLRSNCGDLDLESGLCLINQWWMRAPWQPYGLHWDDRLVWPDPWQLLEDNVFCDLARALGMLYTVAMINHRDLQDCWLAETQNGNLVRINASKYILNWNADSIVNINPGTINSRHQIALDEIKQKIQ